MTSQWETVLFYPILNDAIVNALIREIPLLDIVCVRDVGLAEAKDPEILEWAAGQGRIVVTHDRKTMPDFAAQRIRGPQRMSGLIVAVANAPIGCIIADLLLIVECSTPAEREDRIESLPIERPVFASLSSSNSGGHIQTAVDSHWCRD